MKNLLFGLLFFISAAVSAQSADGIFKTLTAAGTNAYTISEALPAAYNSKEKWIVSFTNASTGAVTLSRAGLGAKAVKDSDGNQLGSGDIIAGQRLLLSYNGTYYQVVGGSGSDLVSGVDIKTLESVSLLGSGNIDLSKGDVGLGNVDNTSDASKPVSTAQATAIDDKVVQTITNGVTTSAPSQDATFDALALKQNLDADLTAVAANGTSLQQIRVPSGGGTLEYFTPLTNPSTTNGDIIYWNAGAYQRLGIGSTGQTLGISAGLPAWSTGGGLTNPMTNIGDLIYGTTAGSPQNLASVSAGSYLRSGGVTTAPVWSTLKLPNAATSGTVVFASATDSWTGSTSVSINDASGQITANRSSTDAGLSASYAVKATRTSAMADGFGAALTFINRDTDAVDNFVGNIGYARSGADNTGVFVVSPNSGGSTFQAFTVTHLAVATAGGNSTQAGRLGILEDTDNGTNRTEFTIGAQSADILYTLPTAVPAANGQVVTSTTAGVWSWSAYSILTGTATLDFGSTAAGAATDLTITVTGAVDGDPCTIGHPNASTPNNGSFDCWISSTNTVTVRFTNNDLLAAKDPASGTFRASVIHY